MKVGYIFYTFIDEPINHKIMKRVCVYSVIIILFSFFFLSFRIANENEEDNFDFPISSETEDCLMCHSTINPGIVES